MAVELEKASPYRAPCRGVRRSVPHPPPSLTPVTDGEGIPGQSPWEGVRVSPGNWERGLAKGSQAGLASLKTPRPRALGQGLISHKSRG